MVELRGVHKRFTKGRGHVDVLLGVDLTVADGEFIALMGPSGSGKTTLLNIIGGIDGATDGQVCVADTDFDRLGSRAMARWRATHIGYVFQSYNLLPVLSAHRNVELPLQLTNLTATQRRRNAAAALEIVGLPHRATHKPGELSGGQEQRVAIARAIVADHAILVCDEPTGDLDRGSANEILDLLTLLNEEHGKTIVMVTHDAKAALYARRTIHLDKGLLAEQAA